MEQLDYNLLYRWLVGLGPDDSLGPDDVYEEPRPAGERRSVCQIHGEASEPSRGEAADL